MLVVFSHMTPPLSDGKLCKGQQYEILALPYVLGNDGFDDDPFHQQIAPLAVTPASLGRITPPSVRLTPAMRVAVLFHYTADRTGHENLVFTATLPTPVTYGPTGSVTRIDRVDKRFDFEVKECTYKVSFGLAIQVAQSGLLMVQFGLMNQTPIKVKEDDTVEGSGSFEFTTIIAQPYCIFDSEDFKTVPRITGKLLPDSHELELTFDYGTGTWQAGGSCTVRGVTVGVPSRSETWDLSPALPRTVKFPQAGAIKSFPINIGPARGTLRIAVEPGRAQ
jgi:hypothetical protein